MVITELCKFVNGKCCRWKMLSVQQKSGNDVPSAQVVEKVEKVLYCRTVTALYAK